MPSTSIWLVDITDLRTGRQSTSYVHGELQAREFMARKSAPGLEIKLRCGVGGPVVDLLLTAPEAGPEVQVQLPPHNPPEPATNKLEAVSRLGRLNRAGPETLGPGSKERKSVLVNLGRVLDLQLDERRSKPELGADLAAALGTTWDSSCWSTGSTLTLVGLNRLLVAAEARLSQPAESSAPNPEAEAAQILEVLAEALPSHMDGRGCVEEMRKAEFSQWAQDEWAGFYFEYVGLPALINRLGGAPVKYANTRFDYSLHGAWDLKWHGAEGSTAILNDTRAVRACLAERSLGFVVLSGDVEYDDGAFRTWFKEHRVRHGKRPAKRISEARYVRKSKTAFTPRRLEAFHLEDLGHLQAAVRAGAVREVTQGRQATGEPRAPKYALDLKIARAVLRLRAVPLETETVGCLPYDIT